MLKSLYNKFNPIIIEPVLLFLAVLIFFTYFVVDMPLNGDTYRYAIAIQTFEGPVVHLGYFLLGSIWYKVLSLFGINPVMALNLMSAFFGALSVTLIYLVTKELVKNEFQSIISALILCVSGSFLLYSIHGEVYVPQLSFILLAILFMLKQHPAYSVLSILTAISITPTSILAIPGLLYILYMRKSPLKAWLIFLSPMVLIAGIILFAKYSAVIYVFSTAIHAPTVFFEDFTVFKLIKQISEKLFIIYIKAFHIFTLFSFVGLVLFFKQRRHIFILMLLFILPFTLYIFNIGLISDDHMILSFVPVVICASEGLVFLLRKIDCRWMNSKVVIISLIGMSLAMSTTLFLIPEQQDSKELKRIINKFSPVYKKDAILLSDYNFGMPFWYYSKEEKNYRLRVGLPNFYIQESDENQSQLIRRFQYEFWIDHTHFLNFITLIPFEKLLISNKRQFYYADKVYQPSLLVRSIIPANTLNARKARASKIERLRNYFENILQYKLKITELIESDLFKIYDIKVVGKVSGSK